MTYDSTEQAYLFTTGTSQDWQWKKTTLNNAVFPNNCTVRAKIKLSNDNSNNQFVFGLQNTHVVVGFTTIANPEYRIVLAEQDQSIASVYQQTITNLNSSVLQLNTWYTVELVYTSTTATFNLYNDSTLLGTASFNTTALDSSSNSLIFFTGMRPSVKQYLKDLTVL